MTLRRFLLVLSLLIMVVLAVVVWFYPSNQDFRPENPFWNGLASFSRQFEATPVSLLDGLPSEPAGTTLVIVPYARFTDSELENVRGYISAGGTLLLLDDYGYGNQILEHLELDLRFGQEVLLDPLFNYRNERLVRITDLAATVGDAVDSIVLNHATSLSGALNAQVVAWSSRFSFLDQNDNSVWDEGEPRGPLPVAAALPVEEGHLVLVADPSILINSMQGIDDNFSFVGNTIEIQEPHPDVLLARTHLPEGSLDEAKGFLASVRGRLSSPLGLSGLLAVALVVALVPLVRKGSAQR